MPTKLYRSRENKIIAGVCGGLGEYFGVDPVLVRIIAVLAALGPGVGVVAYIVAWIIIPDRPLELGPVEKEPRPASWHRYLPGLVLVAVGMVLLIREHWFWFSWDEMLPLVLVGVGLALIVRRRKVTEETSPEGIPDQNVESNPGGQL